MRRLLLGLISALLVICFLFIPPSVSAQENVSTQDATEAASVDYVLPYPGILPDSPLYFLKAVRDRLVGLLVNDPVKKAEFNLLTSDKRINAAIFLANRGKDQLAVDTLSKSNNYMDQAIGATATAQDAGKNIDTVLSNIRTSIKSHKQIADGLQKKVSKKMMSHVQRESKRLADLGKTADKLLPH